MKNTMCHCSHTAVTSTGFYKQQQLFECLLTDWILSKCWKILAYIAYGAELATVTLTHYEI